MMEQKNASKTEPDALTNDQEQGSIAIIGMALKATGTPDKEAYWEALKNGVDCIRDVDEDKWRRTPSWYDPDAPKEAGLAYSNRAGFIPDGDKFDPDFFGISPEEAVFMDPQQRVFLEESWKCLEDAGYKPPELGGKNIGVFVGVGAGDYLQLLCQHNLSHKGAAFTGNSNGVLAARIAHFLDFKGPVLAIDTACSSALIAIDRAVKSIQSGESKMALAGGVYMCATPSDQIWTSQVRILSRKGQCRVFDNQADGMTLGEAAGALLLKPLDRAIADNDRIYGVIKGSGISHNGANAAITIPNTEAQSVLQQSVYRQFNIDPEQIGYVEAHSTGTPKGDPMEVNALIDAFKHFTDRDNYCALGSVKPNIGHTARAAGLCGVVKLLQMFQHRQIVPQANFKVLNEFIDLEGSPFYINTKLKKWDSIDGRPRQAAISSFGFSGMNAHLVLEEFALEAPVYQSEEPSVIILSGKNEDRLKEQAANLCAYLEKNKLLNLHDLAYTLQVGRVAMEKRLAFVATTGDEAVRKLQQFQDGSAVGIFTNVTSQKEESCSAVVPSAGNLAKGDSYEVKIQSWVSGMDVDWRSHYNTGGRPKKLSLPTYPFARERYWIGPAGEIIMESRASPAKEGQDPIYEAPRTPTEKTLVAVWEELFQQTPIGIHAHFFEMGGDSLTAVQLGEMVSEHIQSAIPLTLVYQHPTIRELAEKIQANNQQKDSVIYNPNAATKVFSFPPFFGLGIHYQRLAAACHSYSWHCFSFLPQETRLNIYYEQIKKQQATGPYVLFGFSAGAVLAFEMAQYLEEKGEVVSDVIMGDAYVQMPFLDFQFDAFMEKMQENLLNEELKVMMKNTNLTRARERMNTYFQFLRTTVINKAVGANIHNLTVELDFALAEETEMEGDKNWAPFTNGRYKVYTAKGSHGDIFSPENLPFNANLVDEILKKIEKNNSPLLKTHYQLR